jgi:biopolymer transport protein ExbD
MSDSTATAAENIESPQAAPIAKYKAELRKAIRKNSQEQEVNFLNITAMLDIMTIILVFLLKSLGESSSSIPQNEDLMIPSSVVQTQPQQEGTTVTVSKTQLLVGEEKILTLPSRQSMVQSGVSAEYKRNGPNDPYIVPLGAALQVERERNKQFRKAKGQDASMSEAILIIDGTTPYRILIEVMHTLGQHEFGKFHLMVMQAKASK